MKYQPNRDYVSNDEVQTPDESMTAGWACNICHEISSHMSPLGSPGVIICEDCARGRSEWFIPERDIEALSY